jgi:hypothetical protein
LRKALFADAEDGVDSESLNFEQGLYMGRAIFVITLALLSAPSHGGPVAAQFSSGYGGVAWGTPLDSLVGVLPGGEHHFSTSPGERVYIVRNDDPLFGVPRQGMSVAYHMGKGNVVEYIGIAVPYERRDQLLGVLLSLFGPYTRTAVNQGTAAIYSWSIDNGIAMAMKASANPTNGILEFGVARWSSAAKSVKAK